MTVEQLMAELAKVDPKLEVFIGWDIAEGDWTNAKTVSNMWVEEDRKTAQQLWIHPTKGCCEQSREIWETDSVDKEVLVIHI